MRYLALLSFFVLVGCSSLHNAYERSQHTTGLNFATCEGKFSQNTGDNYLFEYRVLENVEYKGAHATKVEIKNVVGGVGYEMSIYDVFGRVPVEHLSYLRTRGGERHLRERVKEVDPDVVELETQVGRLSLPGGTYDVSEHRDLSNVRGIREAEEGIVNDAHRLFDDAMYDAALKMNRGGC